ncbi:MAG TPA: hypothetical protein VGV92_09155 [Gammaproteobacteria bacterium]|nr:hypothetical protein [Gammaproteobacteria bacterium]
MPTPTLESRKYIRTRKNKKEPEIDVSLELALTPVERPVVKISERPLILLHKLREDFEKVTTAIDDCFTLAIQYLEQDKFLDLNTVITFMQKQIVALDKVLDRVPEKHKELRNSITAFQTKAQSTITDLETLAAQTRAATTDFETMATNKAQTLQL